MAINRKDEILEKALSSDPSAVPRYNLRAPDGTLIGENIALELANAVTQMGTPINAAALNEMLAASGVTAGASAAYTLAQDGFALFDGAPVRFRLHTASGANATLNVNGTGAKPVKTVIGDSMPSGIPAGMWVSAIYSATADAYILTGGSVSSAQIDAWNEKPNTAQTQTIATNTAEAQTKIIARTQLTSAATEVNIAIPNGYRRIRLTASVKPVTENKYSEIAFLSGHGTIWYLEIYYRETNSQLGYTIQKGSGATLGVYGHTSYYSTVVIDMIKTNNGYWSGQAIAFDQPGGFEYEYPRIKLFSFRDWSGTNFAISKSDYKIAAGSTFVLEGLK